MRKMQGYFEKIWSAAPGADENKLWKLFSWIEESGFPETNLPEEYILLLKESNGGDFTNGQREYQLLSVEEVIAYYEAYSFPLYMPYAFPFAMDGCGNFYVFDLRENGTGVYAVSSGNMGWTDDECCRIADSFLECLQQTELLEDILLR